MCCPAYAKYRDCGLLPGKDDLLLRQIAGGILHTWSHTPVCGTGCTMWIPYRVNIVCLWGYLVSLGNNRSGDILVKASSCVTRPFFSFLGYNIITFHTFWLHISLQFMGYVCMAYACVTLDMWSSDPV